MVRAEASWGGWQGVSEAPVRSDLERASNAARRLKLLSPEGLRRFLPRAALLLSHRPIKGYAPSSLLAQTKNQQQRGPFQYFNSLLGETTPQEGSYFF